MHPQFFHIPYKVRGLTILEAIVVMVSIAFLLLYFTAPGCEAGNRPMVSRSQSDLRSLAVGLESYFVDHGSYPVSASGAQGANAFAPVDSGTYSIPTFRNKSGANDPLHSLTTPIAYITGYYADPFAPVKHATFAYHALETTNAKGAAIVGSWLMWSAGPDGDYDIKPAIDFDPFHQSHPTASLTNHTYDPTNGTKSDGDIWRAKQ